jgi:hypothetical protein
MRISHIFACVVLVVCHARQDRCYAQTGSSFEWRNAVNGSFENPANWKWVSGDFGTRPQEVDDAAYFRVDGQYTVTASNETQLKWLAVERGDVSLQLLADFRLSGLLVRSPGGSLTLSTPSGNSLQISDGYISDSSNLTLNDANLTVYGALEVGRVGLLQADPVVLRVLNGSQLSVSGSASVGAFGHTPGSVEVDGSGTTWQAPTVLIGSYSSAAFTTGMVRISNGASFSGQEINIGTGSLVVSNASLVLSDPFLRTAQLGVGLDAGSNALLEISGGSAKISVDRLAIGEITSRIGQTGTDAIGQMRVTGGARVTSQVAVILHFLKTDEVRRPGRRGFWPVAVFFVGAVRWR